MAEATTETSKRTQWKVNELVFEAGALKVTGRANNHFTVITVSDGTNHATIQTDTDHRAWYGMEDPALRACARSLPSPVDVDGERCIDDAVVQWMVKHASAMIAEEAAEREIRARLSRCVDTYHASDHDLLRLLGEAYARSPRMADLLGSSAERSGDFTLRGEALAAREKLVAAREAACLLRERAIDAALAGSIAEEIEALEARVELDEDRETRSELRRRVSFLQGVQRVAGGGA